MLPDTQSLEKETMFILHAENIGSLFGAKITVDPYLTPYIRKLTLCRLTTYTRTLTFLEKYVGGHPCDGGVEVRHSKMGPTSKKTEGRKKKKKKLRGLCYVETIDFCFKKIKKEGSWVGHQREKDWQHAHKCWSTASTRVCSQS